MSAAGIEARESRSDAELDLFRAARAARAGPDFELRLGRKESDLAVYVGELQEQMEQREADWWEKQLGHPVSRR